MIRKDVLERGDLVRIVLAIGSDQDDIRAGRDRMRRLDVQGDFG